MGPSIYDIFTMPNLFGIALILFIAIGIVAAAYSTIEL